MQCVTINITWNCLDSKQGHLLRNVYYSYCPHTFRSQMTPSLSSKATHSKYNYMKLCFTLWTYFYRLDSNRVSLNYCRDYRVEGESGLVTVDRILLIFKNLLGTNFVPELHWYVCVVLWYWRWEEHPAVLCCGTGVGRNSLLCCAVELALGGTACCVVLWNWCWEEHPAVLWFVQI
jgi:hypothetical protein